MNSCSIHTQSLSKSPQFSKLDETPKYSRPRSDPNSPLKRALQIQQVPQSLQSVRLAQMCPKTWCRRPKWPKTLYLIFVPQSLLTGIEHIGSAGVYLPTRSGVICLASGKMSRTGGYRKVQKPAATELISGEAVLGSDQTMCVREMDVYLTGDEARDLDLYVLQFPLRPQYAPPPEVTDASFKPTCEILDMGVIHNAVEEPLRLLSTKVAQGANLGIGVIREGALHISPLKEVLQMRPSFATIATRGSRTYQGETNASDDEESDEENGPATREARPALQKVMMHKKESERAITARLQSYSYFKAQEDGELAQRLQVHPIDSAQSSKMFGKLNVSS